MGTVIGFEGTNVKLKIGTEEMVEKLSTKSMERVKILICNTIGITYHVIGKNNMNKNFII